MDSVKYVMHVLVNLCSSGAEEIFNGTFTLLFK